MKHNYESEHLRDALIEAGSKDPVCLDLSVNDLRHILDALPDQPYPQIALADVRKGDRVRITAKQGSHYEVTVTDVLDRLGALMWDDGRIYNRSVQRVHLIERRVVYPDPKDHPVIIIRGGDFYDDIPMPQDAMWTGTSYESRTHSFQPDDITDWSPAKVVADDE